MGMPLGFERHRFVWEANKMVARVILALYVCIAKGIIYTLEQPMGSTLEYPPPTYRVLGQNAETEVSCVASPDVHARIRRGHLQASVGVQ